MSPQNHPKKVSHLDIVVGTATAALLGITALDLVGLIAVPERPMEVGYVVLGLCLLYVRFFLPGTGSLNR
jgi:uncharacterized membrane protein YuzA (DUF378 family)